MIWKRSFLGSDFLEKINVLVIVGPTASGKTKLAIELAKIFKGEIISADSMQIYKEMDIGTAKPTLSEMENIPHHLIDFLDVKETFSVADYVKLAKEKIIEINQRNNLPIICGGTGLYIDSLINNINFKEEKNNFLIREKLNKIYQENGIEPLLDRLYKIDKKSFEKIHKNNVKRIIRAIEFYEATGMTLSEQIENSKSKDSLYNPIFIGLDFKYRFVLYERINNRVDKMIDMGLVNEAKKILSKDCSKTAKSAICYKELEPYLNGDCTFNVALENLKRATRRYAKRQLTWFRRNDRINWVFVDEYESFEKFIKKCTKHIDFQKNI